MDELKFAMLWHDGVEPFCELCCTVQTEKISVESAPFYVMDKRVKVLSGLLKQFVRWEIQAFSWDNASERKATDKADFSVSFSRRNLAGHIRCEVFLRVDDEPSHGCRFYVDGMEGTQLESLIRQLDAIKLYDKAMP